MPPSLLWVASSKRFVATAFFSAYRIAHVNLRAVASSGSH